MPPFSLDKIAESYDLNDSAVRVFIDLMFCPLRDVFDSMPASLTGSLYSKQLKYAFETALALNVLDDSSEKICFLFLDIVLYCKMGSCVDNDDDEVEII